MSEAETGYAVTQPALIPRVLACDFTFCKSCAKGNVLSRGSLLPGSGITAPGH